MSKQIGLWTFTCAVLAAFLVAVPLYLKADEVPSAQVQVASQRIHITAKSEDGYVIGPVSKGTVVTLQYLSGKWKATGRVASEIPDDPKQWIRNALVIAEHAAHDRPSVVIAVVPSHTADRPFQWLADHDFKRVILRINSDNGNWASHPDAGVMYALTITPPDAASAAAPVSLEVAFKYYNSDSPSTAPVIAATEPTQNSVPPSDIARWRKMKLDRADTQINSLASLVAIVSKSPNNYYGGNNLGQKLDAAKSSRDAIANESDQTILEEIITARAAQAEEVQAEQVAAAQQAKAQQEATEQRRAAAAEELAKEQQQRAQAQADRTALLARIWPNWNGPWKTCPYCGGSGRDADAERAANTAKASAMASQMVGSGQFATAKGAVITCPICGGTGMVPDK